VTAGASWTGDGVLRGRAWVFGDHVDTDAIIPARFCDTIAPDELGLHAMEGLFPGFAAKIRPGDIVVGGFNFGCGSSRETAPPALLGAGVGAVGAKSFARIFFRNAINIGLPIFESEAAADGIEEGDLLAIRPGLGELSVEAGGGTYRLAPYPEKVREIMECGGMVGYVRKKLGRG
jgi:3-isopropylmalate/(R)-2-methylmalate dehydratase small subunit